MLADEARRLQLLIVDVPHRRRRFAEAGARAVPEIPREESGDDDGRHHGGVTPRDTGLSNPLGHRPSARDHCHDRHRLQVGFIAPEPRGADQRGVREDRQDHEQRFDAQPRGRQARGMKQDQRDADASQFRHDPELIDHLDRPRPEPSERLWKLDAGFEQDGVGQPQPAVGERGSAQTRRRKGAPRRRWPRCGGGLTATARAPRPR